jgi:hypothetical protein
MTKLTLLVVVATMAAACGSDTSAKPQPSKAASLDAARAEFNAHKTEPRFLTLLSAT